MTKMIKKSAKKKSSRQHRLSASEVKREKEKESHIQLLMTAFREAGVEIRREKLKRGFGWTVHSGLCSFFDQSVLFLDRNLSLDDQLDFLVGKFKESGIVLGEDQKEQFPASLFALLQSQPSSSPYTTGETSAQSPDVLTPGDGVI